MASINTATKEITCKIVYYGPGMCGKTTNLQKIHEGLPGDNRGNLVSLDTQQERTLFFDFLPLDLGEIEGFKTKFQLYTVPGQVYYNATRKLVLRGVDGLIFVADSQSGKTDENVESWENLIENLTEYGYNIADIPHVLQYNKRDMPGAMSVEEMDKSLNPEGKIPMVEGVASEGRGVKDTLKVVAGEVLSKIRAKMAEKREAPTSPAAARRGDVPKFGERKLIDPNEVKKHRPMLKRREDVKPLSPAPRPEPVKFNFEQPCDVRWKGMRVGRGSIQVSERQNLDGEGRHLVNVESRVWGVFRKHLAGPAEMLGENPAPDVAQLSVSTGNGHRPEILVEGGTMPRAWLDLGGLKLVPAGVDEKDWPTATMQTNGNSEGSHS